MPLKTELARLAAHLSRLYMIHVPGSAGKAGLYDRFIRRHLIWRDLRLIAATSFGARMHVRLLDGIQSRIFFFAEWEPVITRYVASHLVPGDVFIDVGANVGYYSLLASRLVGPGGSVVAIEASPTTFAELSRNLALNSASNVRAVNMAVCAAACETPIYLGGVDNSGASTIVEREASRRDAKVEAIVKGAALQEITGSEVLARARLIKIDVEGAEWLVVQGMREFLPALSDRTEILIEVNAQALSEHGSSTRGFIEIFQRAGFQAHQIHNSYALDEHWQSPTTLDVTPLESLDFDQADILLKRV